MSRVTIDMISDVVCPWCYIGKRHLDRAIALRPHVEIDVRFHPYQLDDTIPAGGMPRIEYMTRKFGSVDRVREIHARISHAGDAVGIAFAFDKILVSPNTLDAHRVIRWAAEAGVQAAVKEKLMQGFFSEGENLAEHSTLARLAGEAGMMAGQVAEWLATPEDIETVKADVNHARMMGVQGVPFFILNGNIGLSGAQPPETIAQAIDYALNP
ncbi:MAG: DsbA family oxidoreductase, partial [Beijerinckiaceae bacterium]